MFEVNLDGLVGPTHFFAGLAKGNLASANNAGLTSNPRAAALQGLAKMKTLMDLGLPQMVMPPQARPDLELLEAHGFHGGTADLLSQAHIVEPNVLLAAYSASYMWTANAAWVSPSPDTEDGRVHFTPSNLLSQTHRAIEVTQTARTLKAIFNDSTYFAHHEPLPALSHLGDEGAANIMRICPQHGEAGLEIFVFGYDEFDAAAPAPTKFKARQSRQAANAVMRKHGLAGRGMAIQQNPEAIDAGCFHNDVIAVSNANVLFCYEKAFVDQARVLNTIQEVYRTRTADELQIIQVSEDEVDLATVVSTYLFNSQLITTEPGKMMILAPIECQESPAVSACLDRIIKGDNPIESVTYMDLRQSMRNGGGPACLRLRVVLSDAACHATHQGVWLNQELYERLVAWVEAHYRDTLGFDDLRDPHLADESYRALDELTRILSLPKLYPFQ